MNWRFLIKGIVSMLLGAAFLWGGFSGKNVAERNLKVVQGVPSDVHISTVTHRRSSDTYTLHFTVDGISTSYDSEASKYNDIVSCVKRSVPVEIGVSAYSDGKSGELYKISANGSEILSYDETVKNKQNSSGGMIGMGALFIVVGLFLGWIGLGAPR